MSEQQSVPQPPAWYRGARGEYYVFAQGLLVLVLAIGPRGATFWPAGLTLPATLAGAALLLAGGALAVAGAFRLGGNLTPLPRPKDGSTLVQTGAYALVRHPIYGGAILLAYGWALLVHGPLTLLYATALLAFFEGKSRREERWLTGQFADYAKYRGRTRRFIPFLH